MKASELSYELSIRLGDPIPEDAINADFQGTVFSGVQRMKYISRAYSKLTRMLKILMRDYQPEFNKRRKVTPLLLSPVAGQPPKNIFTLDRNVKIDELFISYKYKDGTVKSGTAPATYMEPSKYLTNKYDSNDVKQTSFKEGKIKYTTMVEDGLWKLYLLPVATADDYYTGAEYIEQPDFRINSWEDDIPITGDYIDLLIDLAAIQGMQDIARADKAQLITQSIQADWQILGQYGSYMKQVEGVQE